MRIVVLIVGLLALLWLGFFSGLGFLASAGLKVVLEGANADPASVRAFNELDPLRNGIFNILAGVLGLIGLILAFCRYGWQGGLLMLTGVAGPLWLAPASILITGPLCLTALLSFFVRPRPVAAD